MGGFVLLAVLVTAIFLYIARAQVYAEMNNFKLLPQEETFTELYFDNYISLPKVAVANQPFSFSFTIHNVEGATTTYPYAVYFEYPDGTQTPFQTGNVTLSDNASTTITVTHTFIASNVKGEVVVSLTNLKQSIDFILPNTNS